MLFCARLLSHLGGVPAISPPWHIPTHRRACAQCSVLPWQRRQPGLTVLPLARLPEEARHRRVFEMVEALQEHPRDPNQILIGYSRGLIVIWDLQGSRALCHFLSNQVGHARSVAGATGLSQAPMSYSPCAGTWGYG